MLLKRTYFEMCNETKNDVSKYMTKNKLITYQFVDLDYENINFGIKHNSITPTFWVNGDMWFANDFKIENFKIEHKIIK